MHSLFSAVLILTMGFNAQSTWAAGIGDISVNRVVRAAFESKKSAIVASINRRLKKKNFHRGSFFKGEIPEVKKVAGGLARLNPRVVESPGGLTVIVGKGKDEMRVELEFADILAGKLRVAGKGVQLKGGMSYLEAARAIAHPILEPLLKEAKKRQRPKKTSFSTPLDLLISPALG